MTNSKNTPGNANLPIGGEKDADDANDPKNAIQENGVPRKTSPLKGASYRSRKEL